MKTSLLVTCTLLLGGAHLGCVDQPEQVSESSAADTTCLQSFTQGGGLSTSVTETQLDTNLVGNDLVEQAARDCQYNLSASYYQDRQSLYAEGASNLRCTETSSLYGTPQFAAWLDYAHQGGIV